MRHPVVPLRPGVLQTSNYSFDKNNEDEQLQKIIEDQKLNSLRGGIDICPSPSLPGLAFACCAAVLPLLQAKNPVLTKAVQSLLTIALPFVIEPTMSAAETLTTLDHSRLQHLLHRVDQVTLRLQRFV